MKKIMPAILVLIVLVIAAVLYSKKEDEDAAKRLIQRPLPLGEQKIVRDQVPKKRLPAAAKPAVTPSRSYASRKIKGLEKHPLASRISLVTLNKYKDLFVGTFQLDNKPIQRSVVKFVIREGKIILQSGNIFARVKDQPPFPRLSSRKGAQLIKAQLRQNDSNAKSVTFAGDYWAQESLSSFLPCKNYKVEYTKGDSKFVHKEYWCIDASTGEVAQTTNIIRH